MSIWLPPLPPLKHLYFLNFVQQHNYFYNQKNILRTVLRCPLWRHVTSGKCGVGTRELHGLRRMCVGLAILARSLLWCMNLGPRIRASPARTKRSCRHLITAPAISRPLDWWILGENGTRCFVKICEGSELLPRFTDTSFVYVWILQTLRHRRRRTAFLTDLYNQVHSQSDVGLHLFWNVRG